MAYSIVINNFAVSSSLISDSKYVGKFSLSSFIYFIDFLSQTKNALHAVKAINT